MGTQSPIQNRPFCDGRHIGRSHGSAYWLLSNGPERSGKNKGETVMIDALAFAFVALALGIPALIIATMAGSNLNFDW
jgi:hypothetical protein